MCILKSALKLSVGPDGLVTPIWCILSHPASDCMNQVRSLLSVRGIVLGYGFEPRPNNHALQRDRLSSSVYQSTDTRTRINLIDGRKQD